MSYSPVSGYALVLGEYIYTYMIYVILGAKRNYHRDPYVHPYWSLGEPNTDSSLNPYAKPSTLY